MIMIMFNEFNDNNVDRLYNEKTKKINNLMVEICHSMILMMKADVKNVTVLACLLNAKYTTVYEEFINNFIHGTSWTWLDERFDEIIQSNEEIEIEELFTKLSEDAIYEQKTAIGLLQHFCKYIFNNKVIIDTMVLIFEEYDAEITDVLLDYYKAYDKFQNAQKTQF